MGFQHDTDVTQREGRMVAELRPAWGIWGPNGGYMASIALRAAGMHAPAGHRPVSLSVQYLGRAAFADVTVDVELLKGGGTACMAVALAQDGKIFLRAQCWTTSRMQGPDFAELVCPDVPGPDGLMSLKAFKAERGESQHPFWENFETRPIGFYGPPDPDPRGAVLRQWTRFLDWESTPDVFLDACRAVLLIDTLVWPAHWRGCAVEPDYVAPSLDLCVWFHASAGDAEWLLADVSAQTAGQGLIHGMARIWTDRGDMVASGGSQLLVMPKG